MDKVHAVQAFHFKGGQGAKTGTGGHLPGNKVQGKIAEVRGLEEGEAGHLAGPLSRLGEPRRLPRLRRCRCARRPAAFPSASSSRAQHIEEDIDAAFEIGVDYVILDGRGGGTGAAPLIFRDNISVPTMPALARARRHLDQRGTQSTSP